MYYTVFYEQFSDDLLSRTTWTFIALSGMRLELDRCAKWTRKTKRHKWHIADVWSRLEMRNNTIEKPIIPDVVSLGIIESIISDIKFV